MDAATSVILRNIYAFTLNILRRYTIEHIEEGDVALDQLRSQIRTEFEALQAGIDSLRLAKLKTAHENVKDGMLAYEHDRQDEAKVHFRFAQQNAIEAFTTALDFNGKVLATKIRLLSLFHLEGYFTAVADMVYLEALCKQAIEPLFMSAEVQSAVAYHNSYFFSKKESRRVLREVSTVRYALSQLFSGSGRFPLLTTAGKEVDLHEVTVMKVPVTANPTAMTIACDRLYGAWDADAGTIHVWELGAFTELPSLRGHTAGITCLLVSGSRLFSKSNDHTIRVWDLVSQSELACLQATVVDCVLLAAGNRLYAGGWDEKITVWDLLSFKEITRVNSTGATMILAASTSRLYSVHSNCPTEVKVWDLDTVRSDDLRLRGRSLPVTYMLVSGSKLYAGSEDRTIRVWDLSTHTEVASLRGHTDAICCLALNGDRMYAAGKLGSGIRMWDLQTHAEVGCCLATPGTPSLLYISGGKLFVVVPGQVIVRLVWVVWIYWQPLLLNVCFQNFAFRPGRLALGQHC